MEQPGKGMDNSALAEKIRALIKNRENREKELKKIEDMIKKEDEEIRKELERTVREIREEEEEKFKEENEKRRQKTPNLEQTIQEEAPKTQIGQTNQFGYTTIDMQSMQEGNLSVYDLATKQVYDKIKEILNTPQEFRTSEEWNVLKGVTYNLDKVKREEMYLTKKDPNEYVQRTQNLISSFYK